MSTPDTKLFLVQKWSAPVRVVELVNARSTGVLTTFDAGGMRAWTESPYIATSPVGAIESAIKANREEIARLRENLKNREEFLVALEAALVNPPTPTLSNE